MVPINRERVLALCEGDLEDAREFLDVVVESTALTLARLEEAFARSDENAVQAVLHELLGSSGNAGAEELAVLCAQLDRAVKERPNVDPGSRLRELRAAFDRLKAAAASF